MPIINAIIILRSNTASTSIYMNEVPRSKTSEQRRLRSSSSSVPFLSELPLCAESPGGVKAIALHLDLKRTRGTLARLMKQQ